MTPLMLLGLALLTMVVVIALAVVSLRLFGGLRANPAEARASIEKLDDEITALKDRIAALEKTGGSGTWMAMMVLWRNRRRLRDLEERRQRWLKAQRRWWIVNGSPESLRSQESVGRSSAIQPPPLRPLASEDIRAAEDAP